MKVYIGPYLNWYGPYQISEIICKPLWWLTSDQVHNFGKWLSEDSSGNDTRFSKLCSWVFSKRNRTVKIKIDKYDSWNACDTMALIALPLLKQLRETKHGSPFVDLTDVPEHLRYTETEDYDAQSTFDFYQAKSDCITVDCDIHTRWEWVLNEIIWALEQLGTDWESQYWKVKPEIDFDERPEDVGKECTPLRWKVEGEYDREGMQMHQERISNGLRLFGTYFQNLWD